MWIYRKEVQANILVDSDATILFINQNFVRKYHLIISQLNWPIEITNANWTPNKAGQITKLVKTYASIRDYKVQLSLLITSLEDKDMIISYTYLYNYNSEINWWLEIWKHTRCLDTCTNKARIRVLDTKTDSLEFKDNTESVFSKCLSLDKIELEDHKNPSITLFDCLDEDQETIAQVIAELFNQKSVKKIFDNNEDTLN